MSDELRHGQVTGSLLFDPSTGRLCTCPPSTCNGCWPRLSDRYLVTISGLFGPFLSPLNGATVLTLVSGCEWSDGRTPGLRLSWGYDVLGQHFNAWYVYVGNAECHCVFGGPEAPCDPTGGYGYVAPTCECPGQFGQCLDPPASCTVELYV